MIEVKITKQGLEFRFTEEARRYMESMWIEGFESLKNTIKIECEMLEKNKGVNVARQRSSTIVAKHVHN